MLDEEAGQVGRVGQVGQVGQVDLAIDEVARQITEGAPDAGFKARVLARIETIETRDDGYWSWRWAWALSPLAAVVVLILAVLIGRAPQVGLRPDPAYRLSSEVRLKPDPTYAPQVRLKPDATYEAKPASTVRLKRNATYAIAAPSSELAPAPIDIEPLGVEPMDLTPPGIDAMESIAVPRLNVAPLEVPAIGEQ